MKKGCDNYNMLIDCETLIDEEEGPLLFSIIENHFVNIEKLKKNPKLLESHHPHRPSLFPLVKRNSLIRDFIVLNHSNEDNKSLNENRKLSLQPQNYNRRTRCSIQPRKLSLQQTLNVDQESLNKIKKSSEYIKKVKEYEENSLKLCPKVEGRIIKLQ